MASDDENRTELGREIEATLAGFLDSLKRGEPIPCRAYRFPTETGRWSSAQPNRNNISKHVAADYGPAEETSLAFVEVDLPAPGDPAEPAALTTPVKPCGNPRCSCSSGIHEYDDGTTVGTRFVPGHYWAGLTFGTGPDAYGYWEEPCDACARRHEEEHPEHGPCWPFAERYDDPAWEREIPFRKPRAAEEA